MSDVPAYDVQDAVPWNTDSGKNIAPGRAPVPLAFDTDIRSDPAYPRTVCDPATGWDAAPGRTKVSEV